MADLAEACLRYDSRPHCVLASADGCGNPSPPSAPSFLCALPRLVCIERALLFSANGIDVFKIKVNE